MPTTADQLADAYVDCGACGGDGWGCAICCQTGRLPWSTLRPDTQATMLASGHRPYRFVRVDVPLDELARSLAAAARQVRNRAQADRADVLNRQAYERVAGIPDHLEACGNCGAPPEALTWDPADGWSCSRCHATDADE